MIEMPGSSRNLSTAVEVFPQPRDFSRSREFIRLNGNGAQRTGTESSSYGGG